MINSEVMVRFGSIRRGGRFLYQGKVWEREDHGCFARPVGFASRGWTGIHFERSTMVARVD